MQKGVHQRAGAHEVAQAITGKEQLEFATRFDPARQYLRETAKRDDSELLKGRANADANLAFRRGGGQKEAAQTGKLAPIVDLETLRTRATGKSQITAKQRALATRDKNINSNIAIDLGATAQDNRALSSLAKVEFQEIGDAARLANQRRNNNIGLAAAGVSAGFGMAGKNASDTRFAGNEDAFATFKKIQGNENKSFNQFMDEKDSGFQDSSYSERFLGSF